MPELPEVESARQVIERTALGRRIVDVNDSDTYVSRPHQPGEIRAVLLGRRLTAVHRRGKSMWCDTSGVGRRKQPGPTLGIHLGMSGRIIFADPSGREFDGGDYWRRGRAAGDHRFVRFSLTFSDRSLLALADPRRLGRVRLDPPVEALGVDATEITRDEFRALMAGRSAPVKARLLDQESIAGVGNLLADQALWLAKIYPGATAGELSSVAVDRLFQAVRDSVAAAIGGGGVHVLSVVEARIPGGQCPRDGAPMQHATIAGRTTWWCSREQSPA